jgi:hypothetical protein
MGWTKLDNGIIHSTIWRESKETKIVWITMLAMVDKNGNVAASIPGLADAARVTIDECQSALETLLSPDRWSRSKEHEGRRIEEIDGGWHLLNHARYRGPLIEAKKRESNRVRQQRYRDKQKSVTRNAESRCNGHTDTDTDTDSNTDQDKKRSVRKGYREDFKTWWKVWPGQKVGKVQTFKIWERLRLDGVLPSVDDLAEQMKRQVKEKFRVTASGGFAPDWPHPQRWLRDKRWDDSFQPNGQAHHPPMSQQERNLEIIRKGREKREQALKVAGKSEVVK